MTQLRRAVYLFKRARDLPACTNAAIMYHRVCYLRHKSLLPVALPPVTKAGIRNYIYSERHAPNPTPPYVEFLDAMHETHS